MIYLSTIHNYNVSLMIGSFYIDGEVLNFVLLVSNVLYNGYNGNNQNGLEAHIKYSHKEFKSQAEH